MLPVSVARLRICTEPTTDAASTSASKCWRTRVSWMIDVIVTRAPNLKPPSIATISRCRSRTLFVSITTVGRR